MILTIESLVTMNYVKYSQLSKIVGDYFYGSQTTELDIYVDVNSIIKPLFSSSGSCRYEIEDKNALCAAIINMCAHYRAFFKNYQVETNFYIVFSWNNPEHNSKFVKGYNKSFVDSVYHNRPMMDYIIHNIEIMNLICPYLPNIYFYSSQFETSTAIYELLKINNSKEKDNIIISKDILQLQNISYGDIYHSNNVCLLRPLKYEGDQSYFVGYKKDPSMYIDFWTKVCKMRKIAGFEKDSISMLNPKYISSFLAITKLTERNIYALLSNQAAYKMLREVEQYTSNYTDIIDWRTISSFIMANPDKSRNLIPQEIENRCKAIDITYQDIIFANTPEARTITVKPDLYDRDGVHQINNEYFKKCPLDLDRL